MRKYAIVTAAVAVLLAGFDAKAEEGMWTFNNFPFDSIEKSYGFRPSGAWLDHLRLSSVRLADGCSAAFVSPHGLVPPLRARLYPGPLHRVAGLRRKRL